MHPDPDIIDDLVRRVIEVAHPRRMGPDSDIDILVVVPDGTHQRHTAQTIYRRLIGLRATVDVVVATESDLQQYGDNFSLVYYPALREGRAIYAA